MMRAAICIRLVAMVIVLASWAPPPTEVAQAPALPRGTSASTQVYKGQGMTFRIAEHSNGTAEVSGDTTGGGGCMGSFSGSGRIQGNRIAVTARDFPQCTISIVRTGRSISTSETEGCQDAHGARCNFTGSASLAK
jgi:hypothetical protein